MAIIQTNSATLPLKIFKRLFQTALTIIDTPTAKEAAEIREINARTDSTYINAGVVSAEEVRTTLREDVNSGYNALSEEMPESEDFEFGGSETSQSPFSEDEWEESKHPRKANGQFGKGGSSSSSKKTSERQNRVKNRPRKTLSLPKEDAGVIYHNIATFGFTDDEIKDKTTTRFSANYGVTVQINNADPENLSYTIIRKWKLK